MKNTTINPYKATGALTAAAFIAVSGTSLANPQNNPKYPAIPSGWLNAYPTVVQAGTHPTLTWAISHPSDVPKYINLYPSYLTTNELIDVEIRVIGNGVSVTDPKNGKTTDLDTGAYVSVGSSDYEQIFLGTNKKVKPNKVVWSQKGVPSGTPIKFGGQYQVNNQTGPFRHSNDGSEAVRVLINGDLPPTSEPLSSSPALEKFMEPYLDGDGRVKIGPMEALVMVELTHDDSQQDDLGYDLQDKVLLVSFQPNKPKNNNGHGNNLDGVDSSNPGKAPFMQYDSDPNVDDEGSGGGAYPSK